MLDGFELLALDLPRELWASSETFEEEYCSPVKSTPRSRTTSVHRGNHGAEKKDNSSNTEARLEKYNGEAEERPPSIFISTEYTVFD